MPMQLTGAVGTIAREQRRREIDSVARHQGCDTRKCDKRQVAKTIIVTGSRGHRPPILSGLRDKGARVRNVYARVLVQPPRSYPKYPESKENRRNETKTEKQNESEYIGEESPPRKMRDVKASKK